MKINSLYTFALALGLTAPALAQLPEHVGCGTTHADQFATRERLFANRENSAELLQRMQLRDGLIYIPIQFHLVSSDGTDYHPITQVYALLCRINEDLENLDMDIRFYMYGNVRYHLNPLLYDHESTSSDPMAQYSMGLYKVPNITNIFIGRSGQSGDEFGAYYTSGIDVIYSFKDDINGNSSAITHELGHYFTLAHTFFGWENTSYDSEKIQGKAPGLVGGQLVEKVSRPGQNMHENCQAAADGFCDTPADYTTGWGNCNFTGLMFDIDSLPIAPQESNMMSYFPRFCMETFTADQQEAMMLDIYSRGYDRFDGPTSLEVTGAPVLEYPLADAPALYYDLVEFRWQAAPGAVRYLVTVNKMFNGQILSNVITRETMNGETSTWVQLEPNQSYSWSVRPITEIDVCSNLTSGVVNFQSGNIMVGTQEELSSISGWTVFPNPASVGNQLNLEIQSKTNGDATLSLYNALGQQVMSAQNIQLVEGYNLQHLATDMLHAGFYMMVLETNEGKMMQKVVLEK